MIEFWSKKSVGKIVNEVIEKLGIEGLQDTKINEEQQIILKAEVLSSPKKAIYIAFYAGIYAYKEGYIKIKGEENNDTREQTNK